MRRSVEFTFRQTETVVNNRRSFPKARSIVCTFLIVVSHDSLDKQFVHNIIFAIFSKESDELIIFLFKIIDFLHCVFILGLESFYLTFVQFFFFELDLCDLSIYSLILNFQNISHCFEQLSHIIVNFLQHYCDRFVEMIKIGYYLGKAHVNQPIPTCDDTAVCLA
jgi:hypothetical protein